MSNFNASKKALWLSLGILAAVVVAFTLRSSPLYLFARPQTESFCPKISQASLKLDTLNCPSVINPTVAEARTSWSLDKTATTPPLTDPDGSPVSFDVTVTQGPTNNILVATGQIIITNGGEQTPTLSSFVVNLQTKSGGQKYYTIASAVATQSVVCRDGQGIEGGQTCFGQYLNSNGSTLTLTDVNNNDVTALLGSVPIPPSLDCSGAVTLNFKAEFNLSALNLQTGSNGRIEVLTTFAGAGPRGSSPDSVSCTTDADCNGTIGDDNPQTCQVNESESNNVRTVATRASFPIPPLTPVCASVIKTDAGASPIDPACVQASTNSLSNTINKQSEGNIDVEQVSGTASCATEDACATDITNQAAIVCADGRNELIEGSPAQASIPAVCTEKGDDEILAGDFCSATQGCWGQPNNGFCAGIRDNNFTALVSAFANNFGLSAPGGILIGDIFGGLNGAGGGYAARWTSGIAVRDYLPNGTTAGTLTADLNNPLNTSSGVLDAQLLATTLNKARDDAGLFQKNRPERLADLVLQACGNYNIAPSLHGLSVKQLICVADQATSGSAGCSGASIPSCQVTVSGSACGLNASVSATLAELNTALDAVNNNFDNCTANLGCLALPSLSEPPPEE